MSKTYAKIERDMAKTLKERPPKNPRVPTFPPAAEATAQKLREIIDAGGEKATIAYAALSRLCVLWVPGALDSTPLGGGQHAAVVNALLDDMLELFPNGVGLPEPEGCKPL
jgi:hypothetical protein